MREAENPGWAKTFQVYLDDIPRFEERLSQDPYIDMCRLATAEEVRSGNVPVAAPARTYAGQLCYTPETYCLHLRNILRLMERYENYSFLPLHEKELPDYNLFANEGGMALVVRTSEPIIILDIRRPAMVTAFREHLLRKADAMGYGGIYREKTRMQLRALIQELGG